MLGTIESHVLKEMGETVLVILLEDSTYGLRDMELGTLLRLLIVADVVGQSVVQMPHAYVLVNR